MIPTSAAMVSYIILFQVLQLLDYDHIDLIRSMRVRDLDDVYERMNRQNPSNDQIFLFKTFFCPIMKTIMLPELHYLSIKSMWVLKDIDSYLESYNSSIVSINQLLGENSIKDSKVQSKLLRSKTDNVAVVKTLKQRIREIQEHQKDKICSEDNFNSLLHMRTNKSLSSSPSKKISINTDITKYHYYDCDTEGLEDIKASNAPDKYAFSSGNTVTGQCILYIFIYMFTRKFHPKCISNLVCNCIVMIIRGLNKYRK